MDAVQDLVPGKLFAREELLKEAFIGFSNRFGHRCDQAFQTVTGIGHFSLSDHAVFIAVSLVVDQVDVAVHLAVFHERNYQRADTRAEFGFELFEHLIEIRMVHIHLSNKEHLGTAQTVCQFVGLFGAHFHAVPGRYGDQCAFGCDHAFVHTALKVKESGGVDEIDLGTAPCKRCHGGRYRYLALDLLRVKVADSIAVRYLAEPVGIAGLVKQSLIQCGLTTGTVACQRNIPYFTCQILFHGVIAPFHFLLKEPACSPSGTVSAWYSSN